MMELRLHRVAVLRPFTRFLSHVGAPVERGFRRSGLPYYSLENANNYVPSHRFYAFVADMAAREQMEDLGFQAGQYLGAKAGANPAGLKGVFFRWLGKRLERGIG